MDASEYTEMLEYKVSGKYPPHFNKEDKRALRRKAAHFETQGEELFHWTNKDTCEAHKTKVIRGAEEAKTIFTELHSNSMEAHLSWRKTREAISKHFYWPEMSEDIKQWVSECSDCQAASSNHPAEHHHPEVLDSFDLVGIGLIEDLPPTPTGHQHICVMMDYFTKWPQAYPLKTTSAQEVAECILKFFYLFGAPRRIVMGRRGQFVNSVVGELCSMLKIELCIGCPQHPQLRGLLNKMKGTIQGTLRKVVGSHPETWDEHLNAVMFGLRTKRQTSTKKSPYFLMFGREAGLPSEVPEHYPIDESVEDILLVEEVPAIREEKMAAETRKPPVQKKTP